MPVNPIAHSYIREMEELIATVLGDIEPTQIAALSGCSKDKAQELALVKDLVKVNHLINLRNERRIVGLKPITRVTPKVDGFVVEQRMVGNA